MKCTPKVGQIKFNFRPAMKCQSFDEAFFNAFSASFETSTSGGKIGT